MKSKGVAYLLWFFLGWLSAHRFYLGKVGSGILYLLTGQLFGIGWIIDLFILGGMVDNYNTQHELKTIRTATMANAVNQPTEK
jgi:TM2 domain-containing membrane protein YozV